MKRKPVPARRQRARGREKPRVHLSENGGLQFTGEDTGIYERYGLELYNKYMQEGTG